MSIPVNCIVLAWSALPGRRGWHSPHDADQIRPRPGKLANWETGAGRPGPAHLPRVDLPSQRAQWTGECAQLFVCARRGPYGTPARMYQYVALWLAHDCMWPHRQPIDAALQLARG